VIGPRTRSRVRSSCCKSARLPACSPFSPVPGGDIVAGWRACRGDRDQDALPVREHCCERAQGFPACSRLPGQKATLLRVASVLGDRGPGRATRSGNKLLREAQGFLPVPRLSGPRRRHCCGGERVRVIGARTRLPVREQVLQEAQASCPFPVSPVRAMLLRVVSVSGVDRGRRPCGFARTNSASA